MYQDPDTGLPVLLMELMDNSLTHFLESSPQPILYHIQVNFCHDISLALSFLHSNGIVHRDLSSNNVVLCGNVLAKVTDFGMANLGDINPLTRFTMTMCPGTNVYMPPEALQDEPVYTKKIDCFSFGVIVVQTLTRQFPKPGNRLQEIEFSHPGIRARTVLVPVPEVERRQNHISQVDPNHSLLTIALDCLKDKDTERPSAHQLCERIADLKISSKYRDSTRIVQDRDDVIRSQAIRMVSSKEEEIQQLRQQLQQERDQANRKLEERVKQLQLESDQNLQETRRQLQEKEKQFGRVNHQLGASEQVVAQLERQIAELKQLLSQIEQQKMKASSRGEEPTSFKLTWRGGKKMPYKRSRQSDAVVDGNTVYVKKGHTVNIYSYDVTSDSWSQLPDCIHKSDSILIINGWLTAIGGYSYPDYSNKLFSLTRKGSGRTWTEIFPPMPTKRKLTTSLCTGTALIVAGGQGEGISKVLSTVEVMGTETHQWSTAADLPQPMYHASATILCGDQLYMLGGISKDFDSIKSVYTCSVSTLLSPCVKNLQEERSSSVYKASVWEQVADLPVTRSTCESFHGRLLAIGGEMDSGKHSTAVHMYNSATNSWEIISHMTTGRCGCITAVLPDNQLVVVAGGVTDGGVIDVVELASVSVC
jgi:serine/threonine protein kinase